MMSKISEPENTVVSLIPEFYYDLIGRVLPGTLIAFLYLWPMSAKVAHFGAIRGAVAASSCYLLGLTLDVFTDQVFHWTHRVLRPLTKQISFLRVEDDGTLWSWTRTQPAGEQILLKKMFAEKALFRIATFASLASAISPPRILQECPYPITISLMCTGLFLFCVITMHKWISYIKLDRERRNSET
jgi:hypothetical protein